MEWNLKLRSKMLSFRSCPRARLFLLVILTLVSRTRMIVDKRWRAWQILTEKGFNQCEISKRFKMNHA